MAQLLLMFDTETGGLNEDTSDVLTWYGAIVNEELQVIDEINLKLKPDGRLPIVEAGALKVNGINIQQHMLDPETVTYSEGKSKLITLIKKHLKRNGRYSNVIASGYNVPFDLKFTHKHLIPQEEWLGLIHYKTCDVMAHVDFLKMVGWFPKELGSLGTVVEFLGIPKRNAHNAKEDTLMTLDVHKKLIELMKSKKDGGSGTQVDLISLLEAE
jgi:DNA polymerase III epsilon subunit-like protein